MKILFLVLVVVFSFSCQPKESPNNYPRWIGDIKKNSSDNEAFKLCNGENGVKQYFNNSLGLEYLGEKRSLMREYENFVPSQKENQNGIIRIRFIVNCKGVAGRFRIIEADEKFSEYEFDKKITEQLLNTTKNLKGWQIKTYRNKEIDYYQYLIFKIENGKIAEILP